MSTVEFENYSIYRASYDAEPKYRVPLSKLIIENFDIGPYDEPTTIRVLRFCYSHFIDHFKWSCAGITSIRFYQYILSQHEQAIEISLFYPGQMLPEALDMEYIALYRRMLKMILEQACEINLITPQNEEEIDWNEFNGLIDNFYYLMSMIFTCAQSIAQQDMVEDVINITFDASELFVIGNKHHYDKIMRQIMEGQGAHYFKHVHDEKGLKDLHSAFETCFGIKNDEIRHLIASIHEQLKPQGGQYCGFGWETLTQNMVLLFGTDLNSAEQFFKGLTLNRENKMPLENLILRPQNINRYLYRPILIWNIDGSDYAVLGANAYAETMVQLVSNCIPWGKASDEWLNNKCFKQYVHSKEDEHDKWLDDALEQSLNSVNIINYRNVKRIETNTGGVSLLTNGIGEIDSIAIVKAQSKIYIIDCKHLQSRFDIVSQKNDYSNFVQKYDPQIKRKTEWVINNKHLLAEHLNITKPEITVDITNYTVEGVFVINTPTFYMYNSPYRIYTVDIAARVFTGELVDASFIINYSDGDTLVMHEVSYPYFKKPTYQVISFFEDENE